MLRKTSTSRLPSRSAKATRCSGVRLRDSIWSFRLRFIAPELDRRCLDPRQEDETDSTHFSGHYRTVPSDSRNTVLFSTAGKRFDTAAIACITPIKTNIVVAMISMYLSAYLLTAIVPEKLRIKIHILSHEASGSADISCPVMFPAYGFMIFVMSASVSSICLMTSPDFD